MGNNIKYSEIKIDEQKIIDEKINNVIKSIDQTRHNVYLISFQLELMIEIIDFVNQLKDLTHTQKKLLSVEMIVKIYEKKFGNQVNLYDIDNCVNIIYKINDYDKKTFCCLF